MATQVGPSLCAALAAVQAAHISHKIVQAASLPTLAKNARMGHPL